jgi:hypothetical protein
VSGAKMTFGSVVDRRSRNACEPLPSPTMQAQLTRLVVFWACPQLHSVTLESTRKVRPQPSVLPEHVARMEYVIRRILRASGCKDELNVRRARNNFAGMCLTSLLRTNVTPLPTNGMSRRDTLNRADDLVGTVGAD